MILILIWFFYENVIVKINLNWLILLFSDIVIFIVWKKILFVGIYILDNFFIFVILSVFVKKKYLESVV